MAKMSKMDMVKKRIGASSSRDKRITWSGIFGTQASRKAQQERLAPKAKPKAKATGSVGEVSVTAKKKSVPMNDSLAGMKTPAKTASPASRPSGRKTNTMDAGLAARKTLGGVGGLSEDNAVMKRLKQRAMERAVAKAKKK